MPDEQKQPKALTPQMIQRALSVEDYGAAQVSLIFKILEQ